MALVTGAAGGIGRATAFAFGRRGVKVVAADILAEAGEETARIIRETGGESIFIKADVTRAEDVKNLVRKAVDSFGGLDYAHNNAGIEGERKATAFCSEENWDRVLAVNLKSVWLCMKYEILQMVEQGGGGAIVNTASVAGLVGVYKLPAYAASKHGVVGLTKTAALEYGRSGIRINAVCPGLIDTSMVERAVPGKLGQKKIFRRVPLLGMMVDSLERRAVRSYLHRSVPVRRMGTAEEVADAVIWLCSDGASYINGHTLTVDGAYVAH